MNGHRREALRRLAPAVAVVLAMLGGCAPPYDPPAAGASVVQNRAVHVIEPEPVWPAGPPPLDGRRAALVMERYETGEVIEPEEITTGAMP